MISILPNTAKYECGFLASSSMGSTFLRFEATFSISSLATLVAGSTANTRPDSPTISDTWLTVVPVDAPRYNTLLPFFIGIFFIPFLSAAASLLLKGSQILYSSPSYFTSFSPYTLSPFIRFRVAAFFSPFIEIHLIASSLSKSLSSVLLLLSLIMFISCHITSSSILLTLDVLPVFPVPLLLRYWLPIFFSYFIDADFQLIINSVVLAVVAVIVDPLRYGDLLFNFSCYLTSLPLG